eukprot:TRINITY_DN623_c0_g2_i6.p1 TRINITY_DN623_c0_g2~~TRINITY_DN623_c0_g2_i6.p1  ORF type:complete len:208 (+),score=21.25 TRINITY_DN623_c0_g2_i6:356-979(+)
MDSDPANIASANTSTNTTNAMELDGNFGLLPPEIIAHIFSLMETHYDGRNFYNHWRLLENISLVSKQWYQLGQEPSLWESLLLDLKEEKFPEEVKKLVNSKFSRVNSFFIVGTAPHLLNLPHYAHVIFGGQSCSKCFSLVSKLSETECYNLAQISKSITTLGFFKYTIDKDVFRNAKERFGLDRMKNQTANARVKSALLCVAKSPLG